MSKLRGRALEDEFCDIVRELGGDAEGRAAGDAYLEAAHPIVEHDGTSTWALTPKVLGTAEIEILSEAAETMGRILEKLTERYLVDPDLRALFGLDPKAEELTLIPTGYEQVIPFARLDVLFNEETGDFTFAGVSTDSAVGTTVAVDVTRAIQRTESYRRFAERHRSIETFDIADGLLAALRETYQSWANADTGTHHPERPVVGIVDYAESASEGEFADLIERMADEGVFARFVDIRDLRIEGGRRHAPPRGLPGSHRLRLPPRPRRRDAREALRGRRRARRGGPPRPGLRDRWLPHLAGLRELALCRAALQGRRVRPRPDRARLRARPRPRGARPHAR